MKLHRRKAPLENPFSSRLEQIAAAMLTVSSTIGVVAGSSMYQTLAVIAALAEARVIDPVKVAAWAETFAAGQEGKIGQGISEGTAIELRRFADVIRSIATMPDAAGRS